MGDCFLKGNKGSAAQLSIVKGPFNVFVEQKKQQTAYAKQEICMVFSTCKRYHPGEPATSKDQDFDCETSRHIWRETRHEGRLGFLVSPLTKIG